jgi:hypothetical protein
MSMHYHMPGQAVLVDLRTLFCAECSQKMRIVMAAPTQDGRETRTYECVYGHRERVTVALHRRASHDRAPAKFQGAGQASDLQKRANGR